VALVGFKFCLQRLLEAQSDRKVLPGPLGSWKVVLPKEVRELFGFLTSCSEVVVKVLWGKPDSFDLGPVGEVRVL
jgi:hypothetical protein